MSKFTIATMRGVVEHYRAQRLQPICPNCKYILFQDLEDPEIVPEGFEEMRKAKAFIQQCSDHDRPEYPWLHEVDTDAAAAWLVERGNKSKTGTLTIENIVDEWRNALCN